MSIVTEIAVGDELSFRVGGQPLAASTEQLLDFVGSHPVVLVVVEYGEKNEEVLQQVSYLFSATESNSQIAAVSPLRKFRIQWDGRRLDLIGERFEDASEDGLTAATRNDWQRDVNRKLEFNQLGALFAPSTHRRR